MNYTMLPVTKLILKIEAESDKLYDAMHFEMKLNTIKRILTASSSNLIKQGTPGAQFTNMV